MKKRASIFLILVMILSIVVAGCGGGGSSSSGGGSSTGSVTGYLYSNGVHLQITNSATVPTASKVAKNGSQQSTAAYAAVSGGTVTISGTSNTATTAANGSFTISSIPTGSYTVTATAGSLTESFPVTVTSGGTVTPSSDPIRAINGGTSVSVSAFNGDKIYSLVSAQPTSKPQGYGAPTTTYSCTLATTTGTSASSAASIALSGSSFVVPKVLSTKQMETDNMMRQKEAELLANKSRQYNRTANGVNPATAPTSPIVNVTTWNNVNIALTGTTINTVCRGSSTHAYIFVDSRDNMTNLDDYATAFEQIYQVNHNKFGTENDVDGNGKVIIVFSREITDGTLGYFYSGDKYSTSQVANSNVGDIFYLSTGSTPGTSATPAVLKGTLAHEFQHMIYFDQHYNNNGVSAFSSGTWLNEALSQAAEYYNGYPDNHNAWMAAYLNGEWSGLSLTHWTSNNYGYGALFIRYLIDQYGDTAIKNMCSTGKLGITAVESATGADFNTIFNDFTRALVMSGTNDSVNSRYKFTTLNLQQLQTTGRGGLKPGTAVTAGTTLTGSGLLPYAVYFNEWTGSFGTMKLTGTSMNGTVFGLSR